jgi:hypothetical protein
MDAKRTKTAYQTFIYAFADSVLVVCPQCEQAANVTSNSFRTRGLKDKAASLVCSSCGYNKRLSYKPTSIRYSLRDKVTRGKVVVIGAPIDPFFHLPLWLRANVRGNELWAYNHEHLTFIYDFVESKLRERRPGNFNNSIGSKLPRWMTSKSNREDVLKAINKMRKASR